MSVLIVIPARMASTRFPGKPLVELAGKPMIQWVYEAALSAGITTDVIIASPDEEILSVARSFGARAEQTSLEHPSGTDRLAEVARRIRAEIYLNVQGDEPLIDPATIASCAEALMHSTADAASVYCECDPAEFENPAAVKVVLNAHGEAIYFSRYGIPYPRGDRRIPVWKHIGLYAYRPETLRRFVELGPSALEETEGLEQLRLLEAGLKMKMTRGLASPVAVDTPDQAKEANDILQKRSASY